MMLRLLSKTLRSKSLRSKRMTATNLVGAAADIEPLDPRRSH
jgi:hypothetical protein